jgi:C1A family cysteine protease
MMHIADFGLSYGTVEEFEFRQNIYANLDAEIQAHNASGANFQLGHNKMSTWTAAEKKRLNGYRPSGVPVKVAMFDESANADSVNWVTAGAVTGVKDQGQCGSCWSFSTTGGLEGAHQIAGNKLESFSEQQLVDCSKLNHGCNGGSMALAFRYLESHDAILESVYPYTSGVTKKSSTCAYEKDTKTDVEVSDFSMVTPDSSTQLHAALNAGPVSIAIEADKTVFQHYTSGVMDSELCGTNLDHGVLAVGYGTEDSQAYYLVKNSWGTTWGDKGYIKIGVKEGKGICGIQEQPVQPKSN